jgi:hypothetical protein
MDTELIQVHIFKSKNVRINEEFGEGGMFKATGKLRNGYVYYEP